MYHQMQNEKRGTKTKTPLSSQELQRGAMNYVDTFAGNAIPFPVLTESEKRSSLGASMTYVMGMFLSMTQHIMQEREFLGGEAASTTMTTGDVATTTNNNGNNTDNLAVKIAATIAMGQQSNSTIIPSNNNSNTGEAASSDRKPSAASHR